MKLQMLLLLLVLGSVVLTPANAVKVGDRLEFGEFLAGNSQTVHFSNGPPKCDPTVNNDCHGRKYPKLICTVKKNGSSYCECCPS